MLYCSRILAGTHQQPRSHLFVVMLILSSTWTLGRFLGVFLGIFRACWSSPQTCCAGNGGRDGSKGGSGTGPTTFPSAGGFTAGLGPSGFSQRTPWNFKWFSAGLRLLAC